MKNKVEILACRDLKNQTSDVIAPNDVPDLKTNFVLC